MDWPQSSAEFARAIEDNRLFALGREYLFRYLRDCSVGDPLSFAEVMRADLETVEKSYRLRDKFIALNKNYCFDPPEDYLSVTIAIDDSEGDYVCSYTLCLDLELNYLDDMIGG